ATNQADTITGNAADNLIDAAGGDDTVDGGAGNDRMNFNTAATAVVVNLSAAALDGSGFGYVTHDGDTERIKNVEVIEGGALADTFYGDALNNHFIGNDGNDIFGWSDGNDTFEGGNGDDTIYYAPDAAMPDITTEAVDTHGDVTVDFGLGTVTFAGSGKVDTFSDIENFTLAEVSTSNVEVVGNNQKNIIRTGAGDDTISALDGDDTINSGAGADTVDAGAGNDLIFLHDDNASDTYDGGAGIDTLQSAPSVGRGVHVDLDQNKVDWGGSGDDVVQNIEHVIGTDFDDTLIGDGQVNSLHGGDGDDYIEGNAGADILEGGNGIDTAAYTQETLAVVIDLDAVDAFDVVTVTVGGSNDDTIRYFENLIGGNAADTFYGSDTEDNVLSGGGDNDELYGRGG
ncbi:MAG: calcium-binding protein, partial [Pseudomonadota bacterium]|nr:calcium-binding protein [Pseudomonadota bacterium]